MPPSTQHPPHDFADLRVPITTGWLPPIVAEKIRTGGVAIVRRGKFSRAEKKILRRRKKIPVSQHAEKHRIVTMSSVPGPWKNRTTPYLVGIMDASFFSSIREVVVCAAPQTGKSEAVHNCICYAIDRDPGPAMYVYPDENTGKENSRDRIQAMIESSPRLRSYKTAAADDMAQYRINLQHMPIYISWARSPARLANKPIRYVIFDETDKYPETSGKREADPISLGEKRQRWYRFNKIAWKISSPTVETGQIWAAISACQARFDYYVRCPECDHPHVMVFDNIKWPKNQAARGRAKHPVPADVESGRLAWYECPNCAAAWDDEKRDRAVRRGEWRERVSGLELFVHLAQHRPVSIGFQIPSWLSYFVSMSEPAACYISGFILGDPNKAKDFMNGHKAEPWLDYTAERTEDKILALADDRPRGLVPGRHAGASAIRGVAGLTAFADTQKDGFWYEIRAWGWGIEEESWQVRAGFATSLAELEDIFWRHGYKDASGTSYPLHLVLIDAMGGMGRQTPGIGTRTSEVYEWCRLHRGMVFPTQGHRKKTQPISWATIDQYPGTGKKILGGLKLCQVDVTYFKNKLAAKLEVNASDPGAWHMNAETTEEWARQMTAEYVGPKGFWEQIGNRANHAWDCSAGNLAAAEVLGIRYWDPDEVRAAADSAPEIRRPPAAAMPVQNRPPERVEYDRPSWLDR